MKPVTIHASAEAEIAEAAEHYPAQREELGEQFEGVVRSHFERIEQAPASFPLHPGLDGYRKCIIRRFPYTIYFLEREDDVWVAAVSHQRRPPDHWTHRSPDD